ncbi:MAG: hypothetical protein KC449_20300 [Anaerolineales bacterium]|nr:hypothetical protein [Anaerolineales bacterium]
MAIRKLLVLVTFLSFLLMATACTPEAEPAAETTPVAEIAATSEPTAAPTTASTVEPTVAEEPEPTAVPTETADPLQEMRIFADAFQMALQNGDLEAVQSYMSDAFAFGAYRSEWQQGTPEEMLPQIANVLPAAPIVFELQDVNIDKLVDGQDPTMMLGPDVTVALVWHTTGWGAEGQDEAILFVEETAVGNFAWKAMLYAPNGFLPESAELPILDEQPAPVGLLYHKPDGSLWQVAADGQPVQLWNQEGTPAIPAPDGQHAFYQIQGDLWLLDVASGESSQLTSDHDDQGIHLAGFNYWVDSGTILSGILQDWEEGGPNLGHPALIDIATAEITVLDDQHLMSSFPAISANGAIAYSSVQQSADDAQLTWVYNPAAGVAAFAPTEYVGALDGFYTAPAWSVDGRSLSWLVSNGVDFQLAIVDLESKTAVGMVAYPGAAFGGPYPNPIISPDGSKIALRQLTNDPATTGLWLYALDGQEPLFIAHNGGESFWVNEHLLLFLDYDENFNAQLQQYDTLTGTRSVVTLPEVFQIFGIVE